MLQKSPGQQSRTEEESKRELTSAVLQQQIYQGPLPPAEHFAAYNDILPGAADRILTMAEKEAGHRHEIEKRRQGHAFIINVIGQVFAVTIALAGVGGGWYLSAKNNPWSGAFMTGLPVLSLAVVFLKTHPTKKPSQVNRNHS